MTTSSRAYEWDSKLPSFKARIVTCPDCGGARRESPHPHAPRWHRIKNGYVQVDCAGRPVFNNRSRKP